jgi:hypothetical protein
MNGLPYHNTISIYVHSMYYMYIDQRYQRDKEASNINFVYSHLGIFSENDMLPFLLKFCSYSCCRSSVLIYFATSLPMPSIKSKSELRQDLLQYHRFLVIESNSEITQLF